MDAKYTTEKLLTTKDVAALFGMSKRTGHIKVGQWATAKRIRGTKPGRSWLFRLEDVEAYMRKRRNF